MRCRISRRCMPTRSPRSTSIPSRCARAAASWSTRSSSRQVTRKGECVGYLALRDVVKTYDGKTNAVDGVAIAIERGEFVTFLGPSGSGKTTTLMMIAGFEHPTRGTIELGGKNLTGRKPYQRNLGMVFQNYGLFSPMPALKNVVFPLRMRRFPRADMEARARAMLDLVGLARFANRLPRELSGGQQQRVALARGLVFNPDVLLL